MNDRKFVFDWDAQDDTLDEHSPTAVGSNRQGALVPYGRGHIAGMDDYGGAPPPARNTSSKGSGGGGGGGGGAGEPTHLADAMERRKALKQGYDDRHWTEKPLGEMKERDWRIFREDFSISARGGNNPHPLRSWEESEIPETLLECIEKIGYKEPSPIQRQAIPIGLQSRDIIGIAETGKCCFLPSFLLSFFPSFFPSFLLFLRHGATRLGKEGWSLKEGKEAAMCDRLTLIPLPRFR